MRNELASLFRRAIERGNLTIAEATAKKLLRISLTDALELTILIVRYGLVHESLVEEPRAA